MQKRYVYNGCHLSAKHDPSDCSFLWLLLSVFFNRILPLFLSSSGIKEVKCGGKIKINSLFPLPYPVKKIFLHNNTRIGNKQYSTIQLSFFPLSLLAFIPFINQNF